MKRHNKSALQFSKQKTKKVGQRSIYDIIHNSFDMNFKEKVDYIRHHYVYYDGNYEYFHDEKGEPNARRRYLNFLICGILKGTAEPKQLTEFNEQILRWRDRKLALQKKEENIQVLISRLSTEAGGQDKIDKYIPAIERFIRNRPDVYLEGLNKLSFRHIRKLVETLEIEETLDYNKAINDKLTQVIKDTPIKSFEKGRFETEAEKEALLKEMEEEREQRRAEKLMRQYAKDLGFIKDE